MSYTKEMFKAMLATCVIIWEKLRSTASKSRQRNDIIPKLYGKFPQNHTNGIESNSFFPVSFPIVECVER